MHVLSYVQLKRADASMLRSYRAALNQMSSRVAVLLTSMPNVGALTILRECSARCPHVVWSPCNAMILRHVKCGERQLALELFQQMLQEEVKPDPITFVES